jgi:hypothetical protein
MSIHLTGLKNQGINHRADSFVRTARKDDSRELAMPDPRAGARLGQAWNPRDRNPWLPFCFVPIAGPRLRASGDFV